MRQSFLFVWNGILEIEHELFCQNQGIEACATLSVLICSSRISSIFQRDSGYKFTSILDHSDALSARTTEVGDLFDLF